MNNIVISEKEKYAICREASILYGEELQLTVAMEECAELIQAISKFKRMVKCKDKRLTSKIIDNLASEVADVNIMVFQISEILIGSGFSKKVEDFENYKLTRLGERIKRDRK